MNKSIGIIGGKGFVGQILKQYYPGAITSDKYSDNEEIAKVLCCDIIFVAVNFKDNCASKESKMELDRYFNPVKDKVFVVKSTFVPGTLDYFQDKYPQNYFIYNCEFLTERTAWEDFTKPLYQILGVPHRSLHLVDEIFSLLPDAPIKRVISPLDAEMFKHIKNSYYGLKVIFFNQLFDACMQIGADYETIRELLIKDPWIGDSHSQIFHKGYRSYGNADISKCIPKDLEAIRKLVNMPLLDKVSQINDDLLVKQNLRTVQYTLTG